MDSFDLVVIGAGPGGYVCAIRAAQLGLTTACIETSPTLGGTCLNIGCIPSKALLDSSEKFYEISHLEEHGIKVSTPKLDLAKMMKRKDQVVSRLTGGVDYLFKKNKITRLQGKGKLIKSESGQLHAVEIDDGGKKQTVTAKAVVLATGSVPSSIPFLKVDEKTVLTSTGALALAEVPSHLLVVGGGYIGLEMGSVWARLGAKVTVVEFFEKLIPSMDQEIMRDYQKALEAQGIVFKLGMKCTAYENKKGKAVLTLEPSTGSEGAKASSKAKPETLEGSHVLVSVGRVPFTEGLGLETIGVAKDERGFVQVNDNFETSIKNIYAIGDLIGGAMLAHKAEEEGALVAEGLSPITNSKANSIDYALIPGVIYTEPEVASVGFTEEDLTEKKVAFKKGVFPYLANGRAIAMGKMNGKIKMLAHAETHKILGVHIIGPQSSSLIGEAVLAMSKRCTLEEVAHACHPHPTLTEAFKEAALATLGRALHI